MHLLVILVIALLVFGLKSWGMGDIGDLQQ